MKFGIQEELLLSCESDISTTALTKKMETETVLISDTHFIYGGVTHLFK